jgi:hypothetical protein
MGGATEDRNEKWHLSKPSSVCPFFRNSRAACGVGSEMRVMLHL